jgi:ribosomal protein RSM22 (predicted rRNA methylase)
MGRLKNWLKCFLPPPTKTFLREINSLQKQLEQQAALNKELLEQQKKLANAIERVRWQSMESTRYASEAVWAETFNNTIAGSTWLKNTAFAPGRWAAGYPVLYVMYRVLNEVRPKRILELGLGQSTRMIAQYAASHEGVEHFVVEHDPDWIAFFQNDFELSPRSQIVQLDREMVPYKEAQAVRTFKNFKATFGGGKNSILFSLMHPQAEI